ncbi:putative mitochondrial protein [Cucumis melo var. makuwa]|uniref:Mitochondrial protein n=1 Tax=Cucumis melo var. makuwa TaxID=1194695 RepID=A0A5A7UX29_CUCMM|nr:putative mitochondrial protein [Cucumis melo var. makuwa]
MQLYHDALLLLQRLGFVRDRRCNSIMTPYCFLDAWERFLSGVRYLVILYDRNQSKEDGLSLIVEKPWAGAFADHWPRLDNNSVLPRLSVEICLFEGKSAWVLQSSIHNEAPNFDRALTLEQRLIEGQTRWGNVTKVPGEFCFIDCYWEWLEFVVGRKTRLLYNTRLYGVVTASLYTYNRNSDVVRAFCEAWCPSTNTLHTMAGELSISLWDLWFFGGLLRMTLKSFLRPGVFRVASLMAAGTIYSLAVPVLTNIYHGLGLITKASNLIGRMDFHFPMHYVHGWLAHYFGTHYPLPTEVRGPKITNFSGKGWSIHFGEYEARELIHNGARIQWHANLQNRNKHERMVDTHDSSFLQTSYFTTQEPREQPGGKEIRLVEAMAPNLEEEVKVHKNESDSSKSDRHWKRPLKKAKVSGDNPDGRGLSALGVPDVPPLSPLNDHLEGLIELDSDESLTGPHAVDSAFEEVGTSKTPVNKSVEQSLRLSAHLEEIRQGKMIVGAKDLESPSFKEGACPKASLQKVSSTHAPLKFSELPLGASNKQTRRNPEPSRWVGEKVVTNFFQKTALCMWEDIQDKIMRTPFEYIPRFRPEIVTVPSGIEKIHADGLTSLEEYLNSYLKRVDNFNDVQSSYSAQLLSTNKARQLNEKTSAIKEALTLVKQLRGDAKVIQERTAKLSLGRKELEKRLRSINAESEQLSILSCEKAEAIDQQELEIAKLQDEVNTLESTPAITEEAIEALVMVRRSMEAAQEEFKNFKWKL